MRVPLSDNLQSPLSSAPPNPLLPPNRYPNRYLYGYFDSNIDYLDDKLNSDTIEALWPSLNKPSSPTYSQYNIGSRE